MYCLLSKLSSTVRKKRSFFGSKEHVLTNFGWQNSRRQLSLQPPGGSGSVAAGPAGYWPLWGKSWVLAYPKLPEAMGYGLICHGCGEWLWIASWSMAMITNLDQFTIILSWIICQKWVLSISRWDSEISLGIWNTIVILVDMDIKRPIHIVDCRLLGGATTKWPWTCWYSNTGLRIVSKNPFSACLFFFRRKILEYLGKMYPSWPELQLAMGQN